jgi:hypothetical protein
MVRVQRDWLREKTVPSFAEIVFAVEGPLTARCAGRFVTLASPHGGGTKESLSVVVEAGLVAGDRP